MLTVKVRKVNVYDRRHTAFIMDNYTTIGQEEVDLSDLASRGRLKGPDLVKDANRYFNSTKGFRFLTGQSKEKYLKERRAFEKYWGNKLL